MRVFVLCTGRNGSVTFERACKHITNYTAGHETLSDKLGERRFNYPENHIEIDNRLSWFLGQLEIRFGNNAYYIHLIRNKSKTVDSYNRRWNSRTGIIKAFSEGILKIPIEKLNANQKLDICNDYYECINSNISLFLKDKTKKQTIHIEDINEDFKLFWNNIGAEGNLELALKEFDSSYNKSKTRKTINFRYQIKLFLLRLYSIFR